MMLAAAPIKPRGPTVDIPIGQVSGRILPNVQAMGPHHPSSAVSPRFPRRKPAISFTTNADLKDASSQQQIDAQSLSLAAWIPPYCPSDLATEERCQQTISAIDIGKEKIRTELSKLTRHQMSLQASVWVVSGSLPFCDKLISSVRRRSANEYQ